MCSLKDRTEETFAPQLDNYSSSMMKITTRESQSFRNNMNLRSVNLRTSLLLMGACCFLFLDLLVVEISGAHSSSGGSSSDSASDSPSLAAASSTNSRRLLVKRARDSHHHNHHHQYNQHHHHRHHHHNHNQNHNQDLQHQANDSSRFSTDDDATLVAHQIMHNHHQLDYLDDDHRPPAGENQFENQPPPPPPSSASRIKPSESQPVPERLPIVVSSSDNSYVSASPILEITTSAQAADSQMLSNGPASQQQHFRRHLHTRSYPSHSRRHHYHHHHQQQPQNFINNKDSQTSPTKQQRFWHDSRFLDSSSGQLDKSSSSSISDISTTATTTQRNHNQDFVSLSSSNEVNNKESLVSRYEIKLATIINTKESIDSGATFINYTVATNFDACLVECWITDSCDTAIYQESASSASDSEQHRYQHDLLHFKHRFDNDIGYPLPEPADTSTAFYHICFLFECMKADEFRCRFSAHDHYVSSILMKKIASNENFQHYSSEESLSPSSSSPYRPSLNANQFKLNNPEDEFSEISSDNNLILEDGEQNDESPNDRRQRMDDVDVDDDCDHDLRFRCSLAEAGCIELDQRCDGVVQCLDGSDEANCDSPRPDSDNNIPRLISSSEPLTISDNDDGTSTFASTFHGYTLIDQQQQQQQQQRDDRSYKLEQQQQQQPQQLVNQNAATHYSRIISTSGVSSHQLNGLRQWHDTHIASIRIGEYRDYGKGGFNSALIAILFGVGITGMLIMIVGHKMRSIRRRLAYKSRRRSLVPDKELFVNTMPI